MPENLDKLTLEAELKLGIQSLQLVESDLGSFIIGAAQQEINNFAECLINESEIEEIKRFQLEIKARKLALSWLNECILKGLEAKTILEDNHE